MKDKSNACRERLSIAGIRHAKMPLKNYMGTAIECAVRTMVARIYRCIGYSIVAYLLTTVPGCEPAKPTRELPSAVNASCQGGMNFDTGWELSVNASGKATLAVGTISTEITEFVVPEDELARLRELLTPHMSYLQNNQHIFIGSSSPDEVVRTLVVVWGNKIVSVSFHDFSELTPAARKSVQPLIEARHLVRGWIDSVAVSRDVLDMRAYEADAR